jgi:hypothetical protein
MCRRSEYIPMKVYLPPLKDELVIMCSCSCKELHIPFKISISKEILENLECPEETYKPLSVIYKDNQKIIIKDVTGLKGGCVDWTKKSSLRVNLYNVIKSSRSKEDEEDT